jgi:hypothetical protein
MKVGFSRGNLFDVMEHGGRGTSVQGVFKEKVVGFRFRISEKGSFEIKMP